MRQLALLLMALLLPVAATAQEEPRPAVLVLGEGEVSGQPDRAQVTFGAIAQAQEASAAQAQVNRILNAAVAAVRKLGVPSDALQTATLSLDPVYEHRDRREPLIVGYRASTTIAVELTDLDRVGPVIDTVMASGANRLDGLRFTLRDDRAQKQEALRRAVADARAKAEAIAASLDRPLGPVVLVEESQAGIIEPRLTAARMEMAGTGAPIHAGTVRVTASVRIRYRLND